MSCTAGFKWSSCATSEGRFLGCAREALDCCGKDAWDCWKEAEGVPQFKTYPNPDTSSAEKKLCNHGPAEYRWWTCTATGYEGCCDVNACHDPAYCFNQTFREKSDWEVIRIPSTQPKPSTPASNDTPTTEATSPAPPPTSDAAAVAPTPEASVSKSSGGLGKGAIIGIGAGAGVIVLLILIAVVLRIKKTHQIKKENRQSTAPTQNEKLMTGHDGGNYPVANDLEHYGNVNEKDRPPSYAPASPNPQYAHYPQYHEMASNSITPHAPLTPASPASNPFVSPLGTPMVTPNIPQPQQSPHWSTPAPGPQTYSAELSG